LTIGSMVNAEIRRSRNNPWLLVKNNKRVSVSILFWMGETGVFYAK
jgi:hypothetical protein